MKLSTKILVLTILFGIQSALQLLSGVLGLLEGASYAEYGSTFVNAGIMGYLAYVICSTRNKWTYWFAVFFVGLAVLRFITGTGLIAYSGITPSLDQSILIAITILFFGVIPLVLLLDKQVRRAFLSPERS